jgi:riboflavin kinase/FMN adenylyltransferase
MHVTSLKDTVVRPRRIALGEFDGVHVGHRAVIAGSDTVLTFEPHPATVIGPHGAPPLLTSLDVKIDLIAGLGVEELVVVPFNLEFAEQSARHFVDEVLLRQLGATHVSVGENFNFGHRATGTPQSLAADDRFETRIVPLISVDGEIVSSSRIRSLIAAGEVRAATDLLVAPFRVRGPVVTGDQRGRELGYPTANLRPHPELILPAHGVYACLVGERQAAVNVGVRPTFGSDLEPLVEAYLLDFSGDLYGQEITVEFIERLRGEARFESVDTLIEQMHADVVRTRELLA